MFATFFCALKYLKLQEYSDDHPSGKTSLSVVYESWLCRVIFNSIYPPSDGSQNDCWFKQESRLLPPEQDHRNLVKTHLIYSELNWTFVSDTVSTGINRKLFISYITQLYQSQTCLRFYCTTSVAPNTFRHLSERHKISSCYECWKRILFVGSLNPRTHMCNTLFPEVYGANITIAQCCCVIYDPFVSSILCFLCIERTAASKCKYGNL